MKTLSSSRLILRPTQTTDIPDLAKIFGNPRIMKYLFSGKAMSPSEAEAFIRSEFSFAEDGGIGMGTLIEKAGRKIVGFAGLRHCSYLGVEDLELGFVINETAQGNKYGKEIGQRQVEFGFNEVNCRRLLGLVHPQNGASRHILEENLGMKMWQEIETDDRGLRQVFCLQRATN